MNRKVVKNNLARVRERAFRQRCDVILKLRLDRFFGSGSGRNSEASGKPEFSRILLQTMVHSVGCILHKNWYEQPLHKGGKKK